MNKERLEEILKESPFNQHTEEFLINLEDMNEITKIVQELEDHNKKITKHLEGMGRVTKRLREFEELYVRDPRGEEIRLLQKQNKRYHEALEFYAEKENWKKLIIDENTMYLGKMRIEDDYGKKARQALQNKE